MGNVLKFTTDQEFKANLDAFDYDTYLAGLFSDLTTRLQRCGYNGEQELVCSFTLDAKEFKRLKSKGLLGGLYNRDLSNYLHRKGWKNHHSVPSVNDRDRCSRGRKPITVFFRGF